MEDSLEVNYITDMANIKLIETGIKDLFVVETAVFGDNRGYFTETYNKRAFAEVGLNYDFVQDNQSRSVKGVIRGLHFQKTHPQAKLVRVILGSVFDVAVDLRKGSATYGKWFGVTLTAENKKQLMIPRGFAHGFQVLSEVAEFCYKCDDFYCPGDEGGIIWCDPDINISWPGTEAPVLSEKDTKHPCLAQSKTEFEL